MGSSRRRVRSASCAMSRSVLSSSVALASSMTDAPPRPRPSKTLTVHHCHGDNDLPHLDPLLRTPGPPTTLPICLRLHDGGGVRPRGPEVAPAQVHGCSSYMASFPSQLLDIKNWFSSYVYEPPEVPKLAAGHGDDSGSETHDPLEDEVPDSLGQSQALGVSLAGDVVQWLLTGCNIMVLSQKGKEKEELGPGKKSCATVQVQAFREGTKGLGSSLWQ
ncbi:hypothetical protein GUJ93_ZPchr0008g12537 [Zizania palustris]|uniref:Uncharacterized protein n=1 Tax=Zizania palustris TaxID=103762 RepID=A0A8J5VHU5_ZIZPA|nr:hypothetical protein GUJ93_ZPchr0008g12537 [Zizania palustris]